MFDFFLEVVKISSFSNGKIAFFGIKTDVIFFSLSSFIFKPIE